MVYCLFTVRFKRCFFSHVENNLLVVPDVPGLPNLPASKQPEVDSVDSARITEGNHDHGVSVVCVFTITELTRCVSFVRVRTCRNEEKH